MSGQSLGLIETVGLPVAIEAADAAMKSANVELVGYELTKGGGLVTVKLMGDVGAINAAVAAGVAAASRIGEVYASKVIARTASGIERLIASTEMGNVAPAAPATVEAPAETTIAVVNVEPVASASDCIVMEAIEPEAALAESNAAPAPNKKPVRHSGKGSRK